VNFTNVNTIERHNHNIRFYYTNGGWSECGFPTEKDAVVQSVVLAALLEKNGLLHAKEPEHE
jgi:hypothetical protein